MMSKASNSTGRVDIHEMTRAEALAARQSTNRLANSKNFPLTHDLLDAAAEAIRRSLPASFMHQGRRYYLKTSIGLARLEVFDKPTASEPMVTSLHGDMESIGH